ncbi:MAG: class I SAM-dependent methyltransferase, partial [Halobaculum sp.]
HDGVLVSHSAGRHGPGDVRFFDRVARLYDHLMPPARPADLRAGLRFADRPVERVLDAAGGTGRAARALGETDAVDLGFDASRTAQPGRETDDAAVTVLDISPGMLRRAAADGLAVVRGDARAPPIADGAVDAVVVTDALHHVPEPIAALEALTDTVAPGGVIVIREFDPATYRGRGLALLERFAGMQSTFFEPETLTAHLREMGLRAYVVHPRFGYTVAAVVPRERQRENGVSRGVATDHTAQSRERNPDG